MFSDRLNSSSCAPETVLGASVSRSLALAVFGYTLDLGDLGNKLLAVVNALFAVLAILGVVTDPTTAGVGDSTQALTYTEPKTDAKKK